MTWSIVALDSNGAFGVAVASRFFAVGALCPKAASENTRAALTRNMTRYPAFAFSKGTPAGGGAG